MLECNPPHPPLLHAHKRRLLGGGDARLIYRHYATLYFVFAVDSAESELGILDLIQVCPRTRTHVEAGLPSSNDLCPGSRPRFPSPLSSPLACPVLVPGSRPRCHPRSRARYSSPLACPHCFPPLSLWSSPQVFVEAMDKCFENVCELDLIFHVDKVILYQPAPK